jgi:hypothetical protein
MKAIKVNIALASTVVLVVAAAWHMDPHTSGCGAKTTIHRRTKKKLNVGLVIIFSNDCPNMDIRTEVNYYFHRYLIA